MAAFDLTGIDANSFGSDYDVAFHETYRDARAGDVQLASRRGAPPLLESLSRTAKTTVVIARRAEGSSLTSQQVYDNLTNWFDPDDNRKGLRYLKRLGRDGSTAQRLGCYVVDIEYRGLGTEQFVITLLAPDATWQADSATVNGGSPASVTNAGAVAVYPKLELTHATHLKRKRYTVTPNASAEHGVVGYPLRFDVLDAAFSASNHYLIVKGISLTTAVTGTGASGRVWARIDLPADGSAVTVDIVWGSGLVNPKANTLPAYGFDFASSSNTSWQWSAPTPASSNPDLPGVWHLAQTGSDGNVSGGSFGISSDTSSNITFGRATDGSLPNDADSLMLTIGGATGNSLTNLSRVSANHTSGVRSYLRTRAAGTTAYATAWSVTANGTVTAAVAVTDAVTLTVGIEYTSATPTSGATLALSKNGGSNVALSLANTPSLSAAASSDIDRYDGSVTLGIHVLTFADFMVDDGTLTIEHDVERGWRISSSASGATFYGPSNRFSVSDPDGWLLLEPGANSLATTTGAAWSVTHRAGYH